MRHHFHFADRPLRRPAARAHPWAGLAGAALILLTGAAGADPASHPVPATRAVWADTTLAHLPPARLQAEFLKCERLASTTLLDFGSAAQCSMVYEALKVRVFDGDFRRLDDWRRQQLAMQPVAARASTAP
jgi:hypothetical protein